MNKRSHQLIRFLIFILILYFLGSAVAPGLFRFIGKLLGRFLLGVQEGLGERPRDDFRREIIIEAKERDLK